jgi:hypothetical protein
MPLSTAGMYSPGIFKLAASIAFKEGFKKAKPVLLEPIMKVEVETPEETPAQRSQRRGKNRSADGYPYQLPGSQPADQLSAVPGKPVLLEPIMKVEVETPEENTGDVIGDLSRRRGMLRGHTSGIPWCMMHDLWSENAAELHIRTFQTAELQRL